MYPCLNFDTYGDRMCQLNNLLNLFNILSFS